MSSAESPQFVSVDDYLAAEVKSQARNEYVEGWVRAMSGGSVRHNQVIANCIIHFGTLLRGKRCRPFDSNMKLRIRRHHQTRFYYPDVQIVCESNAPTEQFQDTPTLIIEVLSPSTRQYDLDEKLNAYLQIASLEYYIILEQHMPLAIVMRRTPHGFLREIGEGIETVINLPRLTCTIELREIYAGVEFTATCVQESELEYEHR